MRLVYLGTPQMAVPPLQALHAAGHDIVRVISRPDARRSRRGSPSASPVKQAALELGLPVGDDVEELHDDEIELGVVVAYGRIIPTPILDRIPMVNLHFSLLPRWRGAAPVERAILAGDSITGICVMQLEEGLDTGPVFASAELPIGSATASELRTALVDLGTDVLVETLAEGLGEPVPQSVDGVTYAEKITPEDLHLDWTRPAELLTRQVRVGGAWSNFKGQRLKVLDVTPVDHDVAEAVGAAQPGTIGDGLAVATGTSPLVLRRVQPAGKAAMDAAAWANGARPVGSVLGP